jgi:1,4-alpha-glucan branching enzyme
MISQTQREQGESEAQTKKVRIDFHDERAQQVQMAGSFNDWHPAATQMLSLGGGRWVKELVLPPGRYEYRLVVDGEWRCDPCAAGQVPNPFGTQNSVLEVSASHKSAQNKRRRHASEDSI